MMPEREIDPASTIEATSTEIVHRPDQGAGGLVKIVADTAEIVQAFEAYQAAKTALLQPSDYMTFNERGEARSFIKRSGWRKLAIAFGVTFEIIDKKQVLDDRNDLDYAEFTIRAQAPNGRFSDGWGACSADERCCSSGCDKGGYHEHCPAGTGERCTGKRHFTKPRHDIPATAETRAKNRAAADLFGMGEVSAEEVTKQAGGQSTGPGGGQRRGKPEGLSDNKCPECGSAVWDNNADVDAEITDKGESKKPRWKCSSKTCQGGKGNYGWASWDAAAFDPPFEKLVSYVTGWMADGETSLEDLVKLAHESIRNTEAFKTYAGPDGDVATITFEDLPTEVLSDIYTELRPTPAETDLPDDDGGYEGYG